MINTISVLAKDHGLYLEKPSDVLDVIASGLPGCIFTEADIAADFFNLGNGLAGDVFQKFVNYKFRAAFILPEEHGHGDRVTELIRDHKRHSSIRFFNSVEEARLWLQSGNCLVKDS